MISPYPFNFLSQKILFLSLKLYQISFQEAAPLTPKNVIFREKRPCSRWNSLIKTALNRSSSSTSSASASASASSASSASSSFSSTGEKQKIYPVKDGSVCSSPQFFCVASKQMVGIFISVWVRATLKRRLRHLNISSVGCGVMGFMGNKVNPFSFTLILKYPFEK